MVPRTETKLGEEKKTISFPVVNEILMDTAEEASRRPMAMACVSVLPKLQFFWKTKYPAALFGRWRPNKREVTRLG